MIIAMRSVTFKVPPFAGPADEVARSGSEIEHRVQTPMQSGGDDDQRVRGARQDDSADRLSQTSDFPKRATP